MEIIKCTGEHLDAAAEFYDMVTAYLAEHINYPKWTPGEYPGRESASDAIKGGYLHACIEDGKMIGAFVICEDPQGDYSRGNWSRSLDPSEVLTVHALATDPKIYHKGIGRAMVRECIKIAVDSGKKALRLDVVPTNTPAIKLYESMGFTHAGTMDLKRGIPEIPEFCLYELNVDGFEGFRPMRRAKQQLSKEECEEILSRGTSGVLALLGDNDYPYAVPMSYAAKDDKIFFHCAKVGHKIDAVKRHAKASFCIIDRDEVVPEKYTTMYKSVIAFGTVRVLEDGELHGAAELLAKKYYPDDAAEHREAEIDKDRAKLCMFELKISHLTGKQGIEFIIRRAKTTK